MKEVGTKLNNYSREFLIIDHDTVYPKKYAHGFVVLCFVVVMQSFIMNSHEVFIHIHQGCFAGTGAIVRLPQCQWSKPDGYGKISQCITTTKHSKAKTVCIFLGIYCIYNISILLTQTCPHFWCCCIYTVNSLAPGRSFKNVIFNLALLIGIYKSSYQNVIRWIPQDLTDNKSTLVQVMAWCHQVTSHYLNQCWLSSLSPYGVIRPQWVILFSYFWHQWFWRQLFDSTVFI